MESTFIRWLRERIPTDPRIAIGPGDDAAVLGEFEGHLVVTSDLLADGVHFDAQQQDLKLIGRKALAVNLSDLAAMAARPLAATVSVLLSRAGGLEVAQKLYEGMMPLAEEFDIAVAGGDTNTWDGQIVISVTALGTCHQNPLRRDGAQVGDRILVTGRLGGSILGAHLTFQPRVQEALALAANFEVHAACDISDGLLLDLSQITTSSRCGAELTLGTVPISDAAVQLSQATQRAALDHALCDGEDFELLFVTSESTAQNIIKSGALGVPLSMVGRIVAEEGLWGIDPGGKRRELEPIGYQH